MSVSEAAAHLHYFSDKFWKSTIRHCEALIALEKCEPRFFFAMVARLIPKVWEEHEQGSLSPFTDEMSDQSGLWDVRVSEDLGGRARTLLGITTRVCDTAYHFARDQFRSALADLEF